MYPSSNLWVPMLAVFWWRCCWSCCWRWRCCWMCCCLIALCFFVPIVITNISIRCMRASCATHWNIAFSSCLIFCKLLRTNNRFVYNILSNIMIRQSSSTIVLFLCLFLCVLVCLFLYFVFLKQFKVCQNKHFYASWLTLLISILWYIIYIVVWIMFILFLLNAYIL